MTPRGDKLRIEPGQRRAAIAGNEAAGLEAMVAIASRPVEQHTHDGLNAGQVNPPVMRGVFVLKRNFALDDAHAASRIGPPFPDAVGSASHHFQSD